ncbi:hypothetical protein CIG75_12725 [Tumebacillus algifaecis]|uniref:Uncharacterized protein n=1 Tax=Tumebacillus algifaecis TaxID=1214604 RepID=A0A223D2X1_9BACL|nr:baseplate J/gp47 family protein [Tumebacillus algifaecis]ASS75763.1 hypothetical protein CIG75_12725 [Tumebacillus algifaecis]
MSIQFPSADEITHQLVEAVAGPEKTIQDLPNQALTKTLLLAIRDVTHNTVLAAEAVYDARSIFSAVGADLDTLCRERSATVRRRVATRARLLVRLQKSMALPFETPVPVGSLLSIAAVGTPPVEYRTLADVSVPISERAVECVVECIEAGSIGNLPPAVRLLPGMAGIDTAEVIELHAEGADEEFDDSLRARLLDEVRNMEKGGTIYDYEMWAKRINGVVSAMVLPLARGPGSLDVIIMGSNGIPSDELIAEVQAYLISKSHAAFDNVLVRPPTPKMINVRVVVQLERGYSADDVFPRIRVAIREAIQSENEVGVVRLTKIANAVNDTPGVFNFSLTAPTQDITLTTGDLAVPGEIEVAES